VVNSAIKLTSFGPRKLKQQPKKVRLNPVYDMRGGMGGTVDVFGRFESQIQQRSDFFLSGLAAEPTDQPDMSDQKSGTPLAESVLVSISETIQL
jgi:hypothetical protein